MSCAKRPTNTLTAYSLTVYSLTAFNLTAYPPLGVSAMVFTLTWESFPPPNGPLRWARIPWDSDLFGFPIFELRCADAAPERLTPHLSAWLAQLPTDADCLAAAKIAPQAIALGQTLTQHGFYPVETILELHVVLARYTPVLSRAPAHAVYRPATAADLPACIAIAQSAFAHDRYHLDPHLPRAPADRRFALWIERGFRAGDFVYALEDTRRDAVVGFAHYREGQPGAIDLMLGAVNPALQNAGFGVMIYQSTLEECRKRGYKTARVKVSLNNLNSVKPFVRLGMTIRDAESVFHWFRRKTDAV